VRQVLELLLHGAFLVSTLTVPIDGAVTLEVIHELLDGRVLWKSLQGELIEKGGVRPLRLDFVTAQTSERISECAFEEVDQSLGVLGLEIFSQEAEN